MTATQYDLFGKTHSQSFEAWVHTPQGGAVVNRFIRIAVGFHRRGQKIGAKAIAERLRWNAFVRLAEGQDWLVNNNHVAPMARFAMERAPELDGFFETRATGGNNKPRRAVVVEIRETHAG